ncbi:MAG: hypothetical protein JOZ67_05185, partial [Gammaproteobacteria bacterium]|nr:hypothetical protein [Gammaproteobacteria bacterium]
DESTRSFAQAAQLDPQCAACLWGVALTVGPNYNLPAAAAPRARVAWEALQRAQALAGRASPVERALIGALAARYPAPTPLSAADTPPVLARYATAMESVAARFPDDLDVQVLTAEAQMTVNAWKLWTPDGEPIPGTAAIVTRLEAVLSRDPRHPGANHYYIHLMEASPVPQHALAAAERLPGMMPAAGHLEHMPAHIMQRIGRYEDAAEANRRGIVADRAYLAATAPPDAYPVMYYGHNYAFLAFAAAMEGRKAETLSAVHDLYQSAPLSMVLGMGDSGWLMTPPYAALVRFGLWDEMLAVPAPPAQAPGLTAGYLWGRGVALAARGRTAEARAAEESLRQLQETVPADAAAGFNSLRDIIAIERAILSARIAATERRDADAIAALREAVAGEDRLAYNEPADWFFPVRHLLGTQLLIARQPHAAADVFREDLRRNPDNGWALQGMRLAAQAQGQRAAAARWATAQQRAWRHADVRLPGAAFWFPGVDTADCECQHLDGATSAARPLPTP